MASPNDTARTREPITPRTRGLRFGWTNSVYTPPGEAWRFEGFAPSTGPLGMAGVIREYERVRHANGTTYWACALWHRGRQIASGTEVRELIRDYNVEYAWRAN
ncbi:MAG: hypothetical protein FJ318_06160 [SAR202 cluster bacterium]|nr:hypothetical protein [SAR202 cluster bacterium]